MKPLHLFILNMLLAAAAVCVITGCLFVHTTKDSRTQTCIDVNGITYAHENTR